MRMGRTFTAPPSGSRPKAKPPGHLYGCRTDDNGVLRYVINNTNGFTPSDPGFAGLELGSEVPPDAHFGPPLDPIDIVCIGLNYRGHAEECGVDWTKMRAPTIFGRTVSSLNSPNGHVPIPGPYTFRHSPVGCGASHYDYEVELAVVIARACVNVTPEAALDYVLGYTIANDLSERDRQLDNGSPQWQAGKCIPRSFPLGPLVITPDEVGDPQTLELQLTVNGEPRQCDKTSEMIFNVAECISALSQSMILRPGTVISTGTPKGVVTKSKPELIKYPWLKPGDTMELWIGRQDGIDFGRQTQLCVEWTPDWDEHFRTATPPYARSSEFHS